MKEGSTEAPIRHPINFDHPDFLDPKKLDDEMRRVFDICHGCRRCFNLCDSFPKLFDMIDESKNEDVESLSSEQFAPVVDACTLCDMCFMTKCPYVPPHDFNLDFPHLMLRGKTIKFNKNKPSFRDRLLTSTDMLGKLGSKVIFMNAVEHDKIFSITSHLPHLIAYNLVKTAIDFQKKNKKNIIKYSAGGLRDFSRTAASNEIMWRDIFFSNRDNIIQSINIFVKNLNNFKKLINKKNDKDIIKILKGSKKVRKQIIDLKQDISKPNFGRDIF